MQSYLEVIMISKSIIITYPCIIVTFLCAFVISILMKDVVASNSGRKFKEKEILDDLPQNNDIGKYLSSLDKIVQFADTYKLYVDMNFGIGLFLININLRTIFRKKGVKLPDKTRNSLAEVLKANDEVMKYFEHMAQKFIKETNSKEPVRYITQLFASVSRRRVSSWTNHLQKFRTNLIKRTKFPSKRELVKKFSEWPKYVEKVYDFDNHFPSPGFLDNCIGSLAHIPVNHKVKLVKCNITSSCVEIVYNGTKYGYGMTNRLLYMILARFSRGCAIAPGSKDYINVNKFCARIYNEAEYLSQHKFEIPDLSMEQISLCTLLGHAQFLRRSWIDNLLKFQSTLGCVRSRVVDRSEIPLADIYKLERPKWEIIHDNQDIMGGLCNSHTTGVAGGMLSAAIRYILENFY